MLFDILLLYETILYHTILYYTILYYTILYYTILYYTILYYTILYYTILYYTILYYTIQGPGKPWPPIPLGVFLNQPSLQKSQIEDLQVKDGEHAFPLAGKGPALCLICVIYIHIYIYIEIHICIYILCIYIYMQICRDEPKYLPISFDTCLMHLIL